MCYLNVIVKCSEFAILNNIVMMNRCLVPWLSSFSLSILLSSFISVWETLKFVDPLIGNLVVVKSLIGMEKWWFIMCLFYFILVLILIAVVILSLHRFVPYLLWELIYMTFGWDGFSSQMFYFVIRVLVGTNPLNFFLCFGF